MLTTSALVLALAAAPADDVRLRGGIGLTGSAGYSFSPSTAGASPGLDVEIGLTIRDTVALVLRATGGTIIVSSAIVTDAAIEFALSERFYISAGLGLGWLGPLGDNNVPIAVNLVAPARFSWLFARNGNRSGFQAFFELAPGIRLTNVTGSPDVPGPNPPGVRAPLMGIATLGVGYAWK
ncbi:MAG: hypothetical protein DI536_23510 [Archangium gephyra]|uniref:Outer membrane protein beta-barrel domain-containing protein n=1 Tax=Archangium gephyra TaxID=48 RepID=A0A2W5UZP6_9BACT|nr:MAG: hypothetical protein DI536_23510 [Archangium gephyra]